jgi:heme/copper-type cytochrome/quinol oxidase subunit 3
MTETHADALSGLESPEEAAYELRAAEASIWTGSRLLISIFAFTFAALAFAYFYLRSSNSADLWRPNGVTAPTATGAAIMAFTLAVTGLQYYGVRRLRSGTILDWEVAGWTAVLAGLIALGLQCWELTDVPFTPGSSGYASVFTGWAVLNIALLLGGLYWAETLLARHVRLRRAHVEEGGEKSGLLVARVTRINIVSCAHFWMFIGLIAVFFWVFFYVVAG